MRLIQLSKERPLEVFSFFFESSSIAAMVNYFPLKFGFLFSTKAAAPSA